MHRRRIAANAIRQYPLVCRLGGHRRRGRCRLHDLVGGEVMDSVILTLVTFLPAAGAILLMLAPRNDKIIRWLALAISLVAFIFSLHLPANFTSGKPGFQYEVNASWIGPIHYHIGADGISMWLVLLTTF